MNTASVDMKSIYFINQDQESNYETHGYSGEINVKETNAHLRVCRISFNETDVKTRVFNRKEIYKASRRNQTDGLNNPN